MKQLIQKTWSTKKVITIEQDCLVIKTKKISEDLEYKIKFGELGFDLVKSKSKTANISVPGFLVFDLMFAWLLANSIFTKDALVQQLFWGGGLLLFLGFTIGAVLDINKTQIYLTGGDRHLELLAKNPTSDTVDSFIKAIHQAMREYYKTNYSKLDPDTAYEIKLNHLRWLRDSKIITEEEYRQLFEHSKTDNIIGFQRPNLYN